MSAPIGVVLMFLVNSEDFTNGNMMQTEQKFNLFICVVFVIRYQMGLLPP